MEEAVLAEMRQIQADLAQARQKLAAETDPNSLNAMELQDRIDTLTGQYRMILNSAMQATKPPTVNSQQTKIGDVIYTPDPANPDGPWIPRAGTPGTSATVPNLDEQQLKAVENQMAGAKRDEIERNRAAGNGGLTDDQVRTLARLQQDSNTSASTLTLARQKWEQQNQIDLQKLPGELAQTAATTGKIGAETDLTRAQIQRLALKTPSDVAQAEASGALSKAQADRIRQQMGQPTIQDLGTQATYGVMTPGGTIEERYRQGYVPKTRAEIQARAGQITALMNQKSAELQAKVQAKQLTGEEANQQFNAWADQNVDPQQKALQVALEEADFARAKEEAEQRRQNMTGALAAGTQAINAYNAQGVREASTSPQTQAAYSAIQRGEMPNLAGAFTVNQPDLRQQAVDATQETYRALSGLSPTAAQATGAPQPNYGGVDMNEAFSRAPFQFGGGPPAPQVPQHPMYTGLAQGTGPVPGVGAPTGPFGTDQQQINRRLASFQTEAATNQQPNPFQGINPGGMAALMAQQAAAPPPPAPPVAAPAPVGASRYVPSAALPPPAPLAPWGPQATGAMNVGGWMPETPWATQASQAMNVGGWALPTPDPFTQSGFTEGSSFPHVPPPELAPPGIQGLNVPGMNVQGMNLGGQFSGVPWADLFNRYRYGGGGGGNAGFTP